MSYFDELSGKLRQLMLWADLRHEQGSKVKPEMAKLAGQIEKLAAKLAKANMPSAMARREPNALPAIKALRPPGPRRMWKSFDKAEYADRIRGAFLGRAAGCTLGAPVEGWSPQRMAELAKYCRAKFPPEDYWPAADTPYRLRYGFDTNAAYTRSKLRHVPVDDDITYTLLGLLILEEYGPYFNTADVGQAWLKYLPMACTAEHVALENLKAGVPAERAAVKDNPYVEWIGADIRSDPWGYACPGWPEKAAEMAFHDAYLSHRHNGLYGAMYFSAVIAAAFAVDDPVEALRIGLSEIPRSCRLHQDVTWALKVAGKVRDAAKAFKLVQDRFGPINGGMSTVHTNNNACLTVWGVTIGRRDLTGVIGQTVAMGYDCDCTAATAGSIVGAVIGGRNIPARWSKPFGNRCHTYMKGQEWFAIDDVCRRFSRAAELTHFDEIPF